MFKILCGQIKKQKLSDGGLYFTNKKEVTYLQALSRWCPKCSMWANFTMACHFGFKLCYLFSGCVDPAKPGLLMGHSVI